MWTKNITVSCEPANFSLALSHLYGHFRNTLLLLLLLFHYSVCCLLVFLFFESRILFSTSRFPAESYYDADKILLRVQICSGVCAFQYDVGRYLFL